MGGALHEMDYQEAFLRAAVSETIAENLITWLKPLSRYANPALDGLFSLAETASDSVTSDADRMASLALLASASRALLSSLKKQQIRRHVSISLDLELAAEVADWLASTADALAHVLPYLTAGESLVRTFCELVQRIPTFPGKDHWKSLRDQWTLPESAFDRGSCQRPGTTRIHQELVDRVESVRWELLIDERVQDTALVETIGPLWQIHTAARSLREALSKRDSIQPSTPDPWPSWCDTIAEGSERTIAAILIDGVQRNLELLVHGHGRLCSDR